MHEPVGNMKRLARSPENFGYVFDAAIPPRLRVGLAESFVLETEDAFTGRLLAPGAQPTPEFVPELNSTPIKVNPVTGPVYVDGVRSGDLLVVHIERVEPAARGVMAIMKELGPGYSWRDWELFEKPRTYILDHRPGPSGTTRDGTISVGRFTFPMMPVIGTIGVAPEYVPESTIWGQTPAGGVFDHRYLSEGSTLYFNAYHDGGLLFVGDVHGVQGDCEFFGVADETRAEVQLRCEVVSKKRIPFMRIERDGRLIQLYAARPLEQAVQVATRMLMDWLVEDFGCSQEEAYWLVELNREFRITVGVMVTYDPLLYCVTAEVPRHMVEQAATKR